MERKLDPDRQWFTFLIKFARGNIHYETLARVLVTPTEAADGCVATLQLCERYSREDNQEAECEATGWTRQLHKVVANADATVTTAVANYFKKSHEKNDLLSLNRWVSEIDERGRQVKKPFKISISRD